MKKFDIEKAKNGAAVCLSDGTPVKILDFDYNGKILVKYQNIGCSGKTIDRLGDFECDDLYMMPKFAYMNVFKNEDNKLLVGGIIRATREDCIKAGKADLLPGTKWFCVARVELMEEGESDV